MYRKIKYRKLCIEKLSIESYVSKVSIHNNINEKHYGKTIKHYNRYLCFLTGKFYRNVVFMFLCLLYIMFIMYTICLLCIERKVYVYYVSEKIVYVKV